MEIITVVEAAEEIGVVVGNDTVRVHSHDIFHVRTHMIVHKTCSQIADDDDKHHLH